MSCAGTAPAASVGQRHRMPPDDDAMHDANEQTRAVAQLRETVAIEHALLVQMAKLATVVSSDGQIADIVRQVDDAVESIVRLLDHDAEH